MSYSISKKTGLAIAIASLALSSALVSPAAAGQVEQEITQNIIQNILQNVRDQIQRRRLVTTPGRLQFTGEESELDKKNPFAVNDPSNPFAALAYAKSPVMAAPALPVWLYGVNAIGSGDNTSTVASVTRSVTGTGAVDVTKIGIFSATDALTFVGTGSGTWSRTWTGPPLQITDTTTATGSGTLAYLNGGFSADFTTLASWTRVDRVLFGALPPDSSSVAYTGNVQYRWDLPYTFWIEPTVGVTYTEAYTANFGTKIGDATEVHGGVRSGFETKWMGYTVQPSGSAAVFKLVDQNGAGLGGIAGLPIVNGVANPNAGITDVGYGVRTSGKINVIWTDNFSSFLEAHGAWVNGLRHVGFIGSQSYGMMGGLRYTWQ